MRYLSQATLAKDNDLSRSTAYRICDYMRKCERYQKYVRVVSGEYRYQEQAFIRASNERRGFMCRSARTLGSTVLHGGTRDTAMY